MQIVLLRVIVGSVECGQMVKQQTNMKTFKELGEIILQACGEQAVRSGYQISGEIDLAYVGQCALQFGDINKDGTLN